MAKCINCSREIDAFKEFCDECNASLNVMVDAKEQSREDLIDVSTNVLFQNKQITGKILEGDDIVANRVKDDDDTIFDFWKFVYILIIMMILLVLFNI